MLGWQKHTTDDSFHPQTAAVNRVLGETDTFILSIPDLEYPRVSLPQTPIELLAAQSRGA